MCVRVTQSSCVGLGGLASSAILYVADERFCVELINSTMCCCFVCFLFFCCYRQKNMVSGPICAVRVVCTYNVLSVGIVCIVSKGMLKRSVVRWSLFGFLVIFNL